MVIYVYVFIFVIGFVWWLLRKGVFSYTRALFASSDFPLGEIIANLAVWREVGRGSEKAQVYYPLRFTIS